MSGESHVDAVSRTWALVAVDLEGNGIEFFRELFHTSHPSPEGYEPGSQKRDLLFQSQIFKKHAINVMQTIDLAVKGLDDVPSLVPTLQELGNKHAQQWGIKSRHYELVALALINTLEKKLGSAFTPHVKEAWTDIFGVVASAMKAGGGLQ